MNIITALIIQAIATLLIIIIVVMITNRIKNDGKYIKILTFMNNVSIPLLCINAFLAILGTSVIFKKTWLTLLILVFNTYIISYLFTSNKRFN